MMHMIREINSTMLAIIKLMPVRQRWFFLVAVVLMAGAGVLSAVPAVVVGRLVDDMLAEEYRSFIPAIPYFLAIVIAVLFKELLTVFRKWIVEDNCTRLQQKETVTLVSHLLRLDLTFFANHRVGSLNGRIQRSIEGLIRLVKLAFLEFFPAVFAALCAFVVAMKKQPIIGAAMAVGVLVSIIIILWQVSSQRGIRIGLLRDRESIDGTVVEILGAIESVRANNTGDLETRRVDKVAERLRRRELRHHVRMALFDAAKFLCESGTHVAVLSVSVWMAIRGMVSVGEVLAFSMLYINVAAPIRELHRIIDEGHESTLRILDLFELLDCPEDESFRTLRSCSGPRASLKTLPVVEYQNVWFSYPGSKVAPSTIKGATLKVHHGERIGIVGKTGCGKSTLMKLLLRLYKCDQGEILFSGIPLSNVSREFIAKQIGYVSQHPFVFSGSIFENITYNSAHVSLGDVERVARFARIHEEIVNDLGGYNAQVSERGSNLSGGQRQRIALARLFLQDPAVIILDEATAALDSLTETAIQIALDDLAENRTMLIIAHRLNTLRNVDQILVMEHGEIVENGTFNELVKKNGCFAELNSSSLLPVTDGH
jgi:ATP-binding cassette subfamily B protein